jgi:hypothetical protein
MNSYETSATVGDQGQVRIAGVPFAKGTQVQISISPKGTTQNAPPEADEQLLAAARVRMKELFQTVQGFRMTSMTAQVFVDTRVFPRRLQSHLEDDLAEQCGIAS